ncbi:hypothetical protein Cfor_10961 [Coptotermes formosanus]|uniref:Uncharacterized protein n=1 Tax=Coptotermes formosanus TaxID=36987 RepID=A0A6L2Q355_COPFO|nr:hypothetical protein Cfor_10961 [Coptotermes formosanus]
MNNIKITPLFTVRVFAFYLVFYIGLAAFWAACMWGLLQAVDDDTPKYILDRSIIGTSPGLASRPLAPEGRESVLVYSRDSKKWTSTPNGLPSLDTFLEEYQTRVNNTETCSYNDKRENESVVCDVNINNWGNCTPDGTALSHVFEWMPEYYKSSESLPQEMPDDLKDKISDTLSHSPNEAKKVWLSCGGKNEEDKKLLGTVVYFPERGFPGYYYPFRNQIGFRSPVVAVQIVNPTPNVVINLECRAWAPNIEQDRKEQIGVLNYKIKVE